MASPSLKNQRRLFAKLPLQRCSEIDDCWNTLPHLQKHRHTSKVYRLAMKWLGILERGTLRQNVEVGALLAKMKKMGHPPNEVNKLLDRKWTREEREKIYLKLSNRFAQRDKGSRNLSLPQVIYHPRTHSSLFLSEYLGGHEPDITSYPEEIQDGIKSIREILTFPHKWKDSEIAPIVRDIYKWHQFITDKGYIPNGFIRTYLFARNYLNDVKDFIKKTYIDSRPFYDVADLNITPGWFRVEGIPHRRFMVDLFSSWNGWLRERNPERLFRAKSVWAYLDGREELPDDEEDSDDFAHFRELY